MAENPILTAASAASASGANAGNNNVMSKEDTAAALGGIQQVLQQNTSDIVNTVGKLEANRQQEAAAYGGIKEAIQGAATQKQVITLAADTANLEAQNRTMDAFIAGGGYEEQVASMKLLRQKEAGLQQLLDKRADIMDDSHTGIGLIDAIINEFRAVQLGSVIGTAKASYDQTARHVQNVNAAMEGNYQTNQRVKQTINNATIEANQKAIAFDAAIAAGEVELRNLGSNANSLVAEMNARQGAVSNQVTAYNITRQAQQDARQARLDAMEEESREKERAYVQGVRDRAEKEIKDKEAMKARLIELYQAGQAVVGVNVEDKQLVEYRLSIKDPRVEKFIDLGYNATTNGADGLRIGDTAADSYEIVTALDPNNTSQNTFMPRRVFEAAKTSLLAKIAEMPKELRPKTKEAFAGLFNKEVKIFMKGKLNNIATGDPSNPYAAPDLEVLSKFRRVNETNFYKYVLKNSGFTTADPAKLADLALAALEAGKITTAAEVAQDLANIYIAAVSHNNTYNGGFERFNLPPQLGYMANINPQSTPQEQLAANLGIPPYSSILDSGGGLFVPSIQKEVLEASIQTFDLTNVSKWREYIIKRQLVLKKMQAASKAAEEAKSSKANQQQDRATGRNASRSGYFNWGN